MREKTFEGFVIRLTEKQYALLKKRFNPDNFVGVNVYGPYTTVYRNQTPCLCEEVREKTNRLACEGCAFFGQGLNFDWRCGSMFSMWVSQRLSYQFRDAVHLGSHEVRASGDQGLVVITAIYNELLSWKKIKNAT